MEFLYHIFSLDKVELNEDGYHMIPNVPFCFPHQLDDAPGLDKLRAWQYFDERMKAEKFNPIHPSRYFYHGLWKNTSMGNLTGTIFHFNTFIEMDEEVEKAWQRNRTSWDFNI